MALNPNRCEYMLLTNKCVAHERSILLGGEPIAKTGNFKYMGIMLDDKIKFNSYTNRICEVEIVSILWQNGSS